MFIDKYSGGGSEQKKHIYIKQRCCQSCTLQLVSKSEFQISKWNISYACAIYIYVYEFGMYTLYTHYIYIMHSIRDMRNTVEFNYLSLPIITQVLIYS